VPRRRSVKRKAPAPSVRRAKSAGASAFPEVEQLAELMDRHGLLEVDWETSADGVRRVRVSRVGTSAGCGPVHVGLNPAPQAHASAAAAAAALAPSSKPAPAPAPSTEGLHAFKSPMVGTFYRAPSPEAAPFVSVGDKIDEHSTICIIEAMKVMNEITPDKGGEVVSIEVENGEAVEFGQPLFLIRPA
jgi:acetyl-CoA carboxylase biotin carboxyl carrier protein